MIPFEILEQFPAPLWLMNLHEDQVILNGKAKALGSLHKTGHPLAEAISYPDRSSLHETFMSDLSQRKATQHSLHLRTGSRTTHVLEIRCLFKWHQQEYYCGCLIPLNHSANELHLLQETLALHPKAILIIHCKSRAIKFANRSAAQLFGVPESQLWGQDVLSLENAETSELKHILSENPQHSNFFMRARTPGGKRLNLDAHYTQLSHPDLAFITLCDLSPQTPLEEINSLMADAMMESRDAMMLIDAQGTICKINTAFVEMSGFGFKQLQGRNLLCLSQIDPRNNCLGQFIWSHYLSQGSYNGHCEFTPKSGAKISVWLKFFPLQTAHNQTYYCCMMSDISPLKQEMDNLSCLAHQDPLTGLPNRLLFQSRLDHLLQRSKRNSQIFALLYFDLDHFKECNDQYGHQAGDAMLQCFATRTSQILRGVDTLARLGGDEFALLLEDLNQIGDVEIVLHKILQSLERGFEFQSQWLHIECSIGIAIYPKDAENGEDLLQRADSAMYRSKQKNGTHYSYWQKDSFAELELS